LSLVDKALEGFPIAVDDDASELSDGLDALLDPAHPAVVAALREHELDRPLDDAAEFLEGAGRSPFPPLRAAAAGPPIPPPPGLRPALRAGPQRPLALRAWATRLPMWFREASRRSRSSASLTRVVFSSPFPVRLTGDILAIAGSPWVLVRVPTPGSLGFPALSSPQFIRPAAPAWI